MPLFFQQQVNARTRMGIWKIEEAEPFFDVPLQRSITHPHKRLQHLAGRYLLRVLFPDFPLALIRIADTRKPFLADELFHFSISHCGDFAAAIASTENRVGVDAEIISEKVEKIQHKFVAAAELKAVENLPLSHTAKLTLLWSGKEAVYKWFGAGEVDFKAHMPVQAVQPLGDGLFQTRMLFQKKEERTLPLQSLFFDTLCLSWVVT